MRQEDIIALMARRAGVPPDSIDADDLLAEVIPASFQLIELLVELQETCGLRISHEDLPSLRTVGDLASIVAQRRKR